MYDLPEGFDKWSIEKRIEWHTTRVEREVPVFEMLEQMEIMTCFDVSEIKARLFRVRWWRERVESALKMSECGEFQQLHAELTQAAHEAGELMKKRARILALQFRRKSITEYDGEGRELENLKQMQEETLLRVECVEEELVQCCQRHGVSPEPYLVAERLRSST